MNNKKTIVVVGGGPAGMMAAISANSHSANVILVEKNNSLGKKLILTGGGRCNFTNLTEINQYEKHFFHGGKFLGDAFRKFSNKDTLQFFKKNGVDYRVENNNFVFPSTGHAESILEVFKKLIKQNQIKILLNHSLLKVIVKNNRVTGVLLNNNRTLDCSDLILATGGLSYPHTGSNGEGLKVASKLGHKITDLRPGLVSLKVSQQHIRNLEGLSIKNALLVFKNNNKKLRSKKGDFLFTNDGLSGPLALSASSAISDWLTKTKKIKLTIDFYPDLTKEMLTETLKKEITLYPKKNISNLLGTMIVQRLAQEILGMNKIEASKKVSYVTKTERSAIINSLKNMQLDIIGNGPIEKAMITQGGISLKQVCPKTMESRIVKGLYFAGEILDVDGDCGGFNLQSAFSTGYCAGEHAKLSV